MDARTIVQSVSKSHSKLLYPNTPIEIEALEDRVHFYVEGLWDSYETTLQGTRRHLVEILQVNNVLWSGGRSTLRINPGWDGWRKIDTVELDEILGVKGHTRHAPELEN